MKKLIFTLSVLAGVVFNTNAQHCSTPSVNCNVKPATGVPGLTPTSDSLPCIVKGIAQNQTISFENYVTYTLGPTAYTIDSIQIDTIILPTGLCWAMNKASNVIGGGKTGCINVTGTVNGAVPAGQYRLHIAVKAWASSNGIQLLKGAYFNSEGLGLNYWVRVTCPGGACPAVDTVAGKANTFVAYSSQTCNNVGVDEVAANISDLAINPNPFSSVTKVSFTSENEEKYSVRMSNILGTVLFSQEIVSKNGGNNVVAIENKNYANGVYFVTITNGKSSLTRRVVIE